MVVVDKTNWLYFCFIRIILGLNISEAISIAINEAGSTKRKVVIGFFRLSLW